MAGEDRESETVNPEASALGGERVGNHIVWALGDIANATPMRSRGVAWPRQTILLRGLVLGRQAPKVQRVPEVIAISVSDNT